MDRLVDAQMIWDILTDLNANLTERKDIHREQQTDTMTQMWVLRSPLFLQCPMIQDKKICALLQVGI